MKRRILCVLGLAFATASQAFPDGPVSPEKLGGVDAVLSFCGQVNPGAVATYSAYRALYVSQTPADKLAHHPLTKPYKQAFAEVSSALSAASEAWAVKACATVAARPTT